MRRNGKLFSFAEINKPINPFFLADGYKTSHFPMFPDGTVSLYQNFTPRSNKHAPKGCFKLVSFGQQMTMIEIHNLFQEGFFDRPKDEVCQEIKKEYSLYLNKEYDVTHIEKLWDLGYLPLEVKILKEGTLVPMRVPIMTVNIQEEHAEYYWLGLFLETIISTLLWKPATSATIARSYRRLLSKWQQKTDPDNAWFIDWQAHDFSMRGLDSVYAAMSSGLGHATSFFGSDSLPVIYAARKYYNAKGFVVGSVPASEHSVTSAGIGNMERKLRAGKADDLIREYYSVSYPRDPKGRDEENPDYKGIAEFYVFRRLLRKFPTGILSLVSDTFDLFKVLTQYLPRLKDEIMARDGKLVIRPDSGDPVNITCGIKYTTDTIEAGERHLPLLHSDGLFYNVEMEGDTEYNHGSWGRTSVIPITPATQGVVELLWEVFGGKTNLQGYKVLDSHIGMIYGDSITIDRAEEICERLAFKGFASTNVVLGVGSFTYQFNTRDTFGFAMKATHTAVIELGRIIDIDIYKDPATDDGTKKSGVGFFKVVKKKGDYVLLDKVTKQEEQEGEMFIIYKDGEFFNLTTFEEIRKLLIAQEWETVLT